MKTLIIGAGSTGLSTALNLTKAGEKDITVVDKSYVALGQTGECCGFVRTYYNSWEMAYMAHKSMKHIKKLCRSVKDLEYVRKGLLVFENIKKSKDVKKNVRLLKSIGIKAKYLEGRGINKLSPYFNTKNVCAGYDANAGFTNPQIITNYLEQSCKKAGVKVKESTRVLGMKRKNGRFVVKTNKGMMIVDRILNATAAFANNINSMLKVKVPMSPINIDNAFYRLPLGPNKYQIAIADFTNHFYIIPHKDFIDVSSIALDLRRKINPDKHVFNFKHKVVKEYRDMIAKRIIGAEKASSMGGFSSCIDVTPDYYPILSAIDEMPNFYCATGFSGTGFKHFPMVGKIMSQLMLGKKSKLAEFFRYDRFHKGKRRKGVSDSYFVKK